MGMQEVSHYDFYHTIQAIKLQTSLIKKGCQNVSHILVGHLPYPYMYYLHRKNRAGLRLPFASSPASVTVPKRIQYGSPSASTTEDVYLRGGNTYERIH